MHDFEYVTKCLSGNVLQALLHLIAPNPYAEASLRPIAGLMPSWHLSRQTAGLPAASSDSRRVAGTSSFAFQVSGCCCHGLCAFCLADWLLLD